MPTEKIYNELKGEHFHSNNPDMMLKFDKPDKAEIDEMCYKKPITSYKDLPQSNIPWLLPLIKPIRKKTLIKP